MATTESRAFAELLTELKNRSGQSYGALAAKLHVSTSTLHRYCNGDAVPADFAVAERFGRLCGAKGEEFVELHRRWILADEARRRSRSAPPANASAGAVEAEEPSGSSERTEPAEPAEAPAPDAGPPVGATPPSRRRKRLYVTLAAAAVVVAVAVPALVFGPLDDPSSDRSPVASETEAGGAPESAPPSASPSGSPSPDKSPSRGASPSDKATPREKENGGGDAGKGAVGGVPVTVSTKPYAFENPCSQRYLIDRPPEQVPPPPAEPDAPGWVGALGAVASGSQFIELAVQGTGSETVVLKSLDVRVVESGEPLAWNDFGMGVGCGGGVSTKSFAVNLDEGRPASVPKSGQRDFPYKVSESDPEVFYITANASARDVSWYLELQWSSGGRQGTVRVDDAGKPFRTSGGQGRPSYDYPNGGSKWETAAVNDPDQYP
ncbi:helix-turn-helix domain-containing protein [Streptomyces sp. NBC_01716]|uniref:helix-turn-helix domain-containing protein n=1 Tax=Streptomyces sp. NBC_01716 TaxID=2975917 RepID=UPI002E36145B|nr:helix-turn-helix transcriptional regulator [Streptomyces sp. NBC_01716]